MRVKATENGLTVHAVAGTRVVMLGLHLEDAKRQGCLGFAIQREDHVEDERVWLRGMKTFKTTDPGLGPGGTASSREHPFQTFQWSDYSAKSGYDYTYNVVPLYGRPEQLVAGDAVSVNITTEKELGAKHSIWFNNGAVASQEYARRFDNKAPNKIPNNAAYKWLSRGLLEALLAYIAQANGPAWEIYGAIYEFQWSTVLESLKAAADSGAKIRIIFDEIPSQTGPAGKNRQAIQDANIEALCIGRQKGRLMHNKFLVLKKDGLPVSVWTGSTNLTENGLFGHSNLGHIINDSGIAQTYLDYWEQLKNDPTTAELKVWAGNNNPVPPDPLTADTTVVFSPHKGLAVLERYVSIARDSQKPLFMTFAFGMHELFKAVYEQPDGILRFALMEKEGNGSGLAQAIIDIDRIRKLRNVVVAVGNNIAVNSFDRWLAERSKLSNEVRVRFIHTKYMLIDPLGENPIIITGSANFSKASTDTNEENMVIIRNDKRVADIYLGEFMRLWQHYAFREAVKEAQERGIAPDEWQPNFLIEDDSWQNNHYRKGSQRFLRRQYFARL